MKAPIPDGVPRYSLEMFFGESDSEPNQSLEIHPQQIIRDADVIIGEDVMTQNNFLIFGRQLIQQKTAVPKAVRMIVIQIDQETGELEKLLSLVKFTRGSHDYEAG